LIIAGSGYLLEKLRNLTKSLGLESKISFFVGPTDEELGRLNSISNVFVCPSIIDSKGETEGLGLVIVEAMEFNLPGVATSVGGIVDIVKNERNGLLVPEKDPTLIARAIERLILDKELARKIVENSKTTVREFFPRTIAQEYFDIFKTLVNT